MHTPDGRLVPQLPSLSRCRIPRSTEAVASEAASVVGSCGGAAAGTDARQSIALLIQSGTPAWRYARRTSGLKQANTTASILEPVMAARTVVTAISVAGCSGYP
jgi:hypothetical protein